MVGSAVETIVPSSAASSMPMAMVAKAAIRARGVSARVGGGAGVVAVADIVPPRSGRHQQS